MLFYISNQGNLFASISIFRTFVLFNEKMSMEL